MSGKLETPALILQMKSQLNSLTKTERRVADYIIDHPDDVIYLSVAGLAEKSETSDATVIRTCKKLGMTSYQEFKVTLAQSIAVPLKTLNEDIEEGDSIETVVNKVFESTIHTLKLTRDILKIPVIEQAADALYSARCIYIFGMGNSSAVGADLHHKMLRLGLPAIAEADSHLQRIAVATLVREGDVVFAISHSGSSKDVVDTAGMAKKKGAT
jgi:DNA-binding MurR/RpiR family transcriptional regulator